MAAGRLAGRGGVVLAAARVSARAGLQNGYGQRLQLLQYWDMQFSSRGGVSRVG